MSTRQIDVQTVCNAYQEADWVDFLLNNVSYMKRLTQEKHLKSCCSCQEHVKHWSMLLPYNKETRSPQTARLQDSTPYSTIKSVAFFEKYKRNFYKFLKRNGMLYRFIAQKQGLQQKIGFTAVVLCLVIGGILLMSITNTLHPSIQSNAKDSLVVNNMSLMSIKDMSSSSNEQGIALQWANQGELITFELDDAEAANPANVFYIVPSQDRTSFYIVDQHFNVVNVIKGNDFFHAISDEHDIEEMLLKRALKLISN